MPAHRSAAATAVLAGVVVGGAACGSPDEQVVVFAASSLTDAFDRIESDFEAANPGVDVVISYGGSSSLVAQLGDGAPVDVLATADREQMDRATAGRPRPVSSEVFARNSMVVAVEAGNPLGIRGIEDIAAGPVVVLASPEVPAGAYAIDVLSCEDVAVEPASLEPSVRSVATKIALGEADAGLVYRTDIDDRLDVVDIDPDCNVSAEYPIAVLTDAPAAERFVEFVTGSGGASVLIELGFDRP